MKIKINPEATLSNTLDSIASKTEYNGNEWYFMPMVFEKIGDDWFVHSLKDSPNDVKIMLDLVKKECDHEWVSSVAYKGARVCTKCQKYQ